MTNNGLTHVFVGQPVLLKKVVIEKMTKRAVSHVMEQCGDPESFFDGREGRNVPNRFGQGRMHVLRVLPGKMHGSQGMLEAAVFRCRIDPARALQLIDVPKTLEPGRIDEIFLGRFAGA